MQTKFRLINDNDRGTKPVRLKKQSGQHDEPQDPSDNAETPKYWSEFLCFRRAELYLHSKGLVEEKSSKNGATCRMTPRISP